jgi:hypothetical protein
MIHISDWDTCCQMFIRRAEIGKRLTSILLLHVRELPQQFRL